MVFRVHIRRTDKIGTEAAFHPIDEYMKRVNEWYDQQIQNGLEVSRRSIYLATDDPKVIYEAREKLVLISYGRHYYDYCCLRLHTVFATFFH